jgi:hypothetical protein
MNQNYKHVDFNFIVFLIGMILLHFQGLYSFYKVETLQRYRTVLMSHISGFLLFNQLLRGTALHNFQDRFSDLSCGFSVGWFIKIAVVIKNYPICFV